MKKMSVALSAALVFSAPCAASAQETPITSQPSNQQIITQPISPSAITGSGSTSSPLTPTPNASPLTPALPNSAVTVRGSSEVPSILSPSPTETNRIDPSARSRLLVTIDPSRSEVSILNGDVLSSPHPASGVQLNTVIAPATTLVTPQPSPLSPSVYPTRLRTFNSTAGFLSGLGGQNFSFAGGSTFTTGATPFVGTTPATGRITTSRGAVR